MARLLSRLINGVFSTGINIVNLNNLIIAAPVKGKVRLLQSIGRVLRRSKSKTTCTVFDLGDDLRGKRKAPNHTLSHFKDRNELYIREGFKTKLIQVDL